LKISLKKYLLFSSVFAIFTESFFFHFIIDWKLLYLIIFVNYILLLQIKKISINKYFAVFIFALFVHGFLANIIIGIPPNYMISQLLGILVVSTFYYNLIPIYKKEDIIASYLKICVIITIIGYLMFMLNLQKYEDQLHSIFKEPAHYVVVILPACYYFFKKKQFFLFLILFFSLILSKSSLGYIGCAIIFIMPYLTLRKILALILTIPIIIYVGFLTYENNENFKLRIDDTVSSLNSINSGKFKSDTNVSSYALMSNLYVAKNNFIKHPLGSGIGSHVYMHKNFYLKKMTPPEYIKTLKLQNINATDANSLFLRLFSELGVFGLGFILLFLYHFSFCFKYEDLIIAQGIFIYIVLKLIRDGHYFSPEIYFFIWILYYSLLDKKINTNSHKIH
jgi:hypothetical protein